MVLPAQKPAVLTDVAAPIVSRTVPLYELLAEQRARGIQDHQRYRLEVWSAFAGAAFVAFVSLLSLSGYFVSADRSFDMALGVIMGILGVVLCVASGQSLFKIAAGDLRRARLSVEVLQCAAQLALVVALAAAISIGEPRLLQRLGGSLLLLNFLLVLERWIVSKVFDRAATGVGFRLKNLAPVAAVEREGRGAVQTPIEQVQRGDIARLEAPSFCPFDGIVIDGLAQLSERRYGGNAELAFAGKGSEVFAGSKLESGNLLVRVTALAEESALSDFSDALDRSIAAAAGDLEQQHLRINAACLALLLAAAGGAVFFSQRSMPLALVMEGIAGVLLLGVVPRWILLKPVFTARALSRLFLGGALLQNPRVLESLRRVRTIFFESPQYFARSHVEELELLDDRFDRDRLISVVIALLAASSNPRHVALAADLRGLISQPELFALSDCRCYESMGVCAAVGGAEFSVGSEDFMLERGVLLRSADVIEEQPDKLVLYVALDTEIVARLLVKGCDWQELREFAESVKGQGRRLVIFSAAEDARLDDVGREMGLEAADVYPALTEAALSAKLSDRPEGTALFTVRYAGQALRDRADVAFAPFDVMRWGFDGADVLLPPRSYAGIVPALRIAWRSLWFERGALVGTAALTVLGLLGAWVFGFSVPLVQLISMLGFIVVAASLLLL